MTCKNEMPQRDHLSKASVSFEKRQEVISNWHIYVVQIVLCECKTVTSMLDDGLP